MATLIWLDPSSPRRQFFCVGLGAGMVFDRPHPKTALPAWRRPGAIGFLSSNVLAEFGRHPPGESQGNWSRRASLRRLIRQGLPHSTYGRRSPPCDLPKGGPRIPPTVLPTRPVPLALSFNLIVY